MLLPQGASDPDAPRPDAFEPLATALDTAPTTPPGRVASLVEVLVCSGFPTQLLITALLVASGVRPLEASGALSLRFIAWLSAIDTVLLIGLVLLFLRARGERPVDVLLGHRALRGEALLGLALLPVAFGLVAAAALIIGWVAPSLRDPDGNPLAALLRDKANIAVFAAIAVLAGGCREEIQRAFVLHRFDQHLGGATLGLGLFSLAFGIGHLMQGWDAAILTALLGAFWGAVYLWRRSALAPAVCHAAFNLVEVLYHGLRG